uniref:DEPDC5 C-terminal domain-containing protein n=1 Tax=Lygus hesperus TaxID=30085 RepID=A0A0K8SZ43_LYGHE
MVPIPADPFALPCSLKSDPLRGPVFVPVDVESLMGHRSYLFEEFEESTREQRLMLFLEAVALKFGFIRCAVKSAQAQNNQFIHLSGNSFLLIPTHPCDHSVAPVASQSLLSKFGSSPDPSASPHHEYISRLVLNHIHSHETRVGFLWLRNHMVSRRWKLGPTCATSDESFQNKLFADFTAFCKNEYGRLLAFWNCCVEVSEAPS